MAEASGVVAGLACGNCTLLSNNPRGKAIGEREKVGLGNSFI
jgi:hypothetical protein